MKSRTIHALKDLIFSYQPSTSSSEEILLSLRQISNLNSVLRNFYEQAGKRRRSGHLPIEGEYLDFETYLQLHSQLRDLSQDLYSILREKGES